jgi:hypothetical protein
MTRRTPDIHESSVPTTSPSPTLPTLNYRCAPQHHPHTVKQAWPLTFFFWIGSLSSALFILSFHAILFDPASGHVGVTRFLVVLGQSTLVASFSSGMFALAITGKIFHSRRRLIPHPMAAAFAQGASVPALIGICILVSAFSNASPIQLVLLLAVFGLATIYPILSAHWLGDRAE